MGEGNEREFTIKFTKPKAWDKIKQAWDENPMLVIAIGTGAAHALAKVIEAVSGISSKRAYAKRMGSKKQQGE